MFGCVANGSSECRIVSAWLRVPISNTTNTNKPDLVDLGKNLHGTKNGLVVPEYVDIDSIEDLKRKNK